MTMITPSYLGETIEYSSLHACRSTLEDPTTIVERLSGVQLFFANMARAPAANECSRHVMPLGQSNRQANIEERLQSANVCLPRLATRRFAKRDAGGGMKDGAAFVSQPVAIRLCQPEVDLAEVAGKDRGSRQFTTKALAPVSENFANPVARAGLARIAHENRDGASAGKQVAQQILTEETCRPRQEDASPSRHISAHIRMNK